MIIELTPFKAVKNIEKGIKVTSESIKEIYEIYTRDSNAVKYFYEKALESDIENRVAKHEMYKHNEKVLP